MAEPFLQVHQGLNPTSFILLYYYIGNAIM